MIISAELKQSLMIVNNSNVINDQTFRSLIETCFLEITRSDPNTNVKTLNISKPDVTKELRASFMTLITEIARHNLKPDAVRDLLTIDLKLTASRTSYFCELLEKHRTKLQIALGNIGTYLPNVVDVKWTMDYVVKSSDVAKGKGPTFRVSLITERYDEARLGNVRDSVEFSCSSQELQDLVYKLKEALRHCAKVAAER